MTRICPTVLAGDPHAFRQQMERIAPFAERVQIDLSDGVFAPIKTVGIEHVWWLHSVIADIHLMYKEPAKYIDKLIKLDPHLVIIHAEAEGDFPSIADRLHEAQIHVGVALMPDTSVDVITPVIDKIDHVLVFAGELGKFGGKPQLADYVGKLQQLGSFYPGVEIGWDGGITDENVREIRDMGVDVLNVGGYIQHAEDPAAAYQKLTSLIH